MSTLNKIFLFVKYTTSYIKAAKPYEKKTNMMGREEGKKQTS